MSFSYYNTLQGQDAVNHLSHIAILGSNGAVGRLFSSNLLRGPQVRVTGADLQAESSAALSSSGRYIQADVTCPPDELLLEVRTADCILFCLPKQTALDCAPLVADAAREGALLVDTLSIKEEVCAMWQSRSGAKEVLSINPLFAPDLGFEGQTVAAVTVRPGVLTSEFLDLIASWEAKVVQMSAEQHDRQMALVQALTHAVILAFGLTLAASDYKVEAMMQVSTPPHRALLALLARILRGEPTVYREIQVDNRHAGAVRAALSAGTTLFDNIAQSSEEDFRRGLQDLRTRLGPRLDELGQDCARMFQAIRSPHK